MSNFTVGKYLAQRLQDSHDQKGEMKMSRIRNGVRPAILLPHDFFLLLDHKVFAGAYAGDPNRGPR
jgi:hypothetical protein